jgi:hypothetical protein
VASTDIFPSEFEIAEWIEFAKKLERRSSTRKALRYIIGENFSFLALFQYAARDHDN